MKKTYSFGSFFLRILAGAESLAGAVPQNVVQKIRQDVEILQEENNMLKLKVEILLNLVAESIAEMPAAQK